MCFSLLSISCCCWYCHYYCWRCCCCFPSFYCCCVCQCSIFNGILFICNALKFVWNKIDATHNRQILFLAMMMMTTTTFYSVIGDKFNRFRTMTWIMIIISKTKPNQIESLPPALDASFAGAIGCWRCIGMQIQRKWWRLPCIVWRWCIESRSNIWSIQYGVFMEIALHFRMRE